MVLVASILLSLGLFAQLHRVKSAKVRPRVPAWVSEKGYWVVESNFHTPHSHTVFFYNNENQLMYKETLDGIKLNPEKRKIKMKLKKALETAALAWSSPPNVPGPVPVEQSIVMAALR